MLESSMFLINFIRENVLREIPQIERSLKIYTYILIWHPTSVKVKRNTSILIGNFSRHLFLNF